MNTWIDAVGFTLLSGILGWLANSVYKFNRELASQEKRIIEEVSKMVAREKDESILAHRRLDVTDQTLGDLTEEKYSSRLVTVGAQPPPKISKVLKKILNSES